MGNKTNYMELDKAARADFIVRMLRSHLLSLTEENGLPKIIDDSIEKRRNADKVIICNAAIGYYQYIKEKEGDGRQIYNRDLISKSFIVNETQNMEPKITQNDRTMVKGNLSKKTIAYCLTAIICAIILAFSIYQSGRYSTTMDGGSVIDKYKNVNKNVEYNWRRR